MTLGSLKSLFPFVGKKGMGDLEAVSLTRPRE